MSDRPLLFDASGVFGLVRELLGEAPDLFWGNSTISLAYYEVGNALWRECFLLNRIVPEEASKLLKSMFSMLRTMDVTPLEDESLGKTILDTAGKLNITYYDAAYLTEAQRSDKVLVTDDEELARAAEKVGVETLTSKTVRKQLSS
ncbi:MAG: type II toxin-antitoxin system VapC family toxin [Candidatus Bathyarchaeia archaeon]